MKLKAFIIFLSLLGASFFTDSAQSMLSKTVPVVRKASLRQMPRFYSSVKRVRPVRLHNNMKVKDNSWKRSLFYSLKSEIDFNKERCLSIPVSLNEAGPGSIHEGSIEQYYRNSMQEEFRGKFPHMYIDTLEEISENPSYIKFKNKILKKLEKEGLLNLLEMQERSDEENIEILHVIASYINDAKAHSTRKNDNNGWVDYLERMFEKGKQMPHYLVKLSDYFDETDDGMFYGDCRVVNAMLGLMAIDLGIPADKMFVFYSQDPVAPRSSAHFNFTYKTAKDELVLIDAFYFNDLSKRPLKISNKFYRFPDGSTYEIRFPHKRILHPVGCPIVEGMLKDLRSKCKSEMKNSLTEEKKYPFDE